VNMINKEELLTYFKESATKPLTVHEIEDVLGLHESDQFKTLIQTLNELEQAGELVRTRKNRYGLPEEMNLIRGNVQMDKIGFAFLIPDDDERDDIYVPSSDLHSAMNGDTVIVRLEKGGSARHRSEGVVIRIVSRANREVVGTFE